MKIWKQTYGRVLAFVIIIVSTWTGYTTECAAAVQNVAVIVYTKSKLKVVKFLLAHEKKNGIWVLPGGGIDNKENPIDAAARELYEETAAEPYFDPKNFQGRIVSNYTYKGHTEMYIYKADDGSDQKIDVNTGWKIRVLKLGHSYKEMDKWKWVDYSEVMEMIKNKEIKFNSLKDYIDSTDLANLK